MNTKIIMKSSALMLGFTGLMLTFFPQELSESLGHSESDMMTRTLEVIGAMYLAFGMMNWMSRKSLIGGIYNRPIAIANMTHFMMVGIMLTKWKIGNHDLPYGFWAIALIYLFFATAFIKILFTTPRIGSIDQGSNKG